MNPVLIIYILCGLFDDGSPYWHRNLTCGVDRSNTSIVYEGRADVATYPWMGTFYYPMGQKKITTAVVLITKQIVLAAANEIDVLPKRNLRKVSWVVIGRSCESPGIRIRDYSFHPDFRRDTYSALALIQLEVDLTSQELRPICGPPPYFINPKIYAMTTSNNCKKGLVQIRRMKYVNKEQCRDFYRRSGLDETMYWPSHATCARSLSGGKCMWRSGTALVVKQDGHWRLLGFGLYGPGCQSPARFLDYGMHQQWVRNSVTRIGLPAITRLQPNHVVMRRSLAHLQRFGPCDLEETKYEMYTDLIRLKSNVRSAKASYNFTIIHGVEYSCIMLRAEPPYSSSEEDPRSCSDPENPKLHLRRWCAGPPHMCYGFQFLEIHFFVEIEFMYTALLKVAVYGKEAKIISPLKGMVYANSVIQRPYIYPYVRIQKKLEMEKNKENNLLWFHRKYDSPTNHPKREPAYMNYYKNKQKLNYTFGK